MKKKNTVRYIIRNDDNIVKDHRVHGVRIMPGVVFLDLIYKWLLSDGFVIGKIELQNILFKKPISTSIEYDREIEIKVEKKDEVFAVTGRSRKVKDENVLEIDWEENLQCELCLNEKPMPEAVSVDRLKKEAEQIYDMDEIYGFVRGIQIQHYEFMKALGKVYAGEKYTLAELHLGNLSAEYLKESVLHPTFMDSSTLVPAMTIIKNQLLKGEEGEEAKPYIPMFMESFRAWEKFSMNCFVYVNTGNITFASNDLMYSDILLLNSNGQPVACMGKLAAKRIRSKELILDGNKDSESLTDKKSLQEIIEQDLKEQIARTLGTHPDSISLEDGYYEQGLDSVNLLDLVKELEAKLQKKLYPTLLFEYNNIKELAAYFVKEFGESYNQNKVSIRERAEEIRQYPVSYFTYDYVESFDMDVDGKDIDSLLIFEKDKEISGQIDKITGGNVKILRVRPGDHFCVLENRVFSINPEVESDYEELIHYIRQQDINMEKIIYAWPAEEFPFLSRSDEVSCKKSIRAIFFLSKIFLKLKMSQNMHLVYIYAGSEHTDPYNAAISSFFRTLSLENPRFIFQAVGIDTEDIHSIPVNYIEKLLLELSRINKDDQADQMIYYRDGRRYAKIMYQVDKLNENTGLSELKQNGAYIITGGAGGLGKIFARYLADRTKAQIVLIGRADKNENDCFPDQNIIYISADIGVRNEADKVVKEIKARYGNINGVIHAAGICKDAFIINKSFDDFELVMNPKVMGTVYLDESLKNEPLDFFVMFSSTAAVLGNIGQSDYAYANGFMDCYSSYRSRLEQEGMRQGITVSINWPYWKSGGMKLDDTTQKEMKSAAGILPLETEAGLAAFEAALQEKKNVFSVVAGNTQKILRVQGVRAEEKRDSDRIHSINYSKNDMEVNQDIAIIGISGRYPMADDVNEFWKNVKEGKNCITDIPKDRWDNDKIYHPDKNNMGTSYSKRGGFINDVDKFDYRFFHLSPKEAALLDPQERIFLQTVWHAVEDAGYTRESLSGSKTGVFVGIMWGQYQMFRANQEGKTIVPASIYASVANRVSYFFDFHGPSLALDTMCSSSLTAIHYACESLRKGESSIAVAGGMNLSIHKNKYLFLSQGRFLSSEGRCRSFGEGGDGYVPGEGAGAVILKPLTRAIGDKDNIYGVIKGSAINHGGKTSGYSVPNPQAQAEVIKEAYENVKVNPKTVSYIEAHGTGTSLGDPIEITGLEKVFNEYTDQKQFCAIGSVKSNIGHLESAAGIASVTKVLMQMKYGRIAPSLHSSVLNTNIDFKNSPFYVPQKILEWKRPCIESNGEILEYPRRAGISAFGAGGANAHVIIEEYNSDQNVTEMNQSSLHLVILSAKNGERLRKYAESFLKFVKNEEKNLPPLSDIAYTLQVGREQMDERIAIIVSDIRELESILDLYLNGGDSTANLYIGNRKQGKEESKQIVCADNKQPGSGESERKDLEELAMLWTAGNNLDWKSRYAGLAERRCSLPVYPFEKKRCWIDAEEGDETQKHAASNLHPLIDSNVSTLKEELFKKTLMSKDIFVSDHKINGVHILPGAAQLEMAAAAGVLADPGSVITNIRNVKWIKPVSISDNFVEAYVSLYLDDNDLNFEIKTKRNQKEEIHSFGQLVYGSRMIHSDKIDIKKLTENYDLKISGREVYEGFDSTGFLYGESLKVIQTAYMSQQHCISRLRLPDQMDGNFDNYFLHPSIIDGAFQNTALLLENSSSNSSYLPYGVEDVRIFGIITKDCYAFVCKSNDAEVIDTKQFDICIADENGNVAVEMKNFLLKKVSDSAIHNAVDNKSTVYLECNWKEMQLTENRVLNHSENIIIYGCHESGKVLFNEGYSKNKLVTVEAGKVFRQCSEYEYEVDPLNLDDWKQLLACLRKKELFPNKFVYCYRNIKANEDVNDVISEGLDQGIYTLFHIAKAFMEEKIWNNTIIYCLYDVHPKLHPFFLALGSFARTALSEKPDLQWKVIEYPQENSLTFDTLLPMLQKEAEEDNIHDIEVRYEQGVRYIKTMQEVIPEKTGVHLEDHGVYLITGGLGGLGKIFAEHLLKQPRKVILTGRSEADALQMEKLNELKNNGADLEYKRCNISDRNQVKRLIADVVNRYGQIHGILHCAGVIKDGLIINKNQNDMKEVLGSKIFGTVFLEEEIRGLKLDFFVLFSSLAGVMGNVGQSDYAFANSFMDQYADRINSRSSSCPVLSINWPLWNAGGMQIDADAVRLMEKNNGIIPISGEEGIHVFENLLGCSKSQVVVLKGNRKQILKCVGLEKTEDFGSENMLADAIEKPKLKNKMTELLKELFSYETGIPDSEIIPTDLNEDLGIDSVMIMNITRKLEEDFGTLGKTLFYEYNTIDAVSEYLAEHYSDKLFKKFKGTVLSREVMPEYQEVQKDRPEKTEWNSIRLKKKEVLPERDDIAIVGISGRYPMADNLEEFWNNLKDGKDCISEIPEERWDYEDSALPDSNGSGKPQAKWGGFIKDVDKFDPLFFHISPRDAYYIDPQERIFLESVWHTVEDAGYTKASLGSSVGVFVGVMYGHYQLFGAEETLKGNKTAVNSSYASIANRVSYFMNFEGPSMAVDTMCSSSLTAVHLACDSIRRGECNSAVAGGINLSIHPNKYILLAQGGFVSSDGRCRSFGAGGDGYVPGEGVGSVLLKHLKEAERDGDKIYAVIKASSLNHGGRTNGYTVPNPNAQANVISHALKMSGINPKNVSYIEAHGTGTSLGDPIEINGLNKAFSEYIKDNGACAIGSVKSNIGHLESAAGMAGIAKVILQMKHKKLVPSIHSDELNPNINFEESPFAVQKTYDDWKQKELERNGKKIKAPRCAGISAFGAGGANAFLLLEEYNREPENTAHEISQDASEHIILLSAKNKERLLEYVKNVADYIGCQTGETNSYSNNKGQMAAVLDDRLVQIAAEVLQIGQGYMEKDASFEEMGITPFDICKILETLNESLHLDTELKTVYPCNTISELAEYLTNQYEDRLAELQDWRSTAMIVVQGNQLTLADISYTLMTGREEMEERAAFVVRTVPELIQSMRGFINQKDNVKHVYSGNMKNARPVSKILSSGKAAESFIRIIIEEREYAKIADLWCAGVAIDWSLVYQKPHKKVSLPLYPFERSRYWIESKSSAGSILANECRPANIHPLVHKNISDLEGLKYSASMKEIMHVIAGVKRGEESVLPGSLCIEWMLVAGSISAKQPVQQITGFYLNQPYITAQEEEIHILLESIASCVQCKIYTDENVIAMGTLGFAREESGASEWPKAELSNILHEISWQKTEFYDYLKESGYPCEEEYHVIQKLFSNGEITFAEVNVMKTKPLSFKIHLTILEAVTQAVKGILLFQNENPDDFAVRTIQKITVYGDMNETKSICLRKRSVKADYDVWILDKESNILAFYGAAAVENIYRPDTKIITRPLILERKWKQSGEIAAVKTGRSLDLIHDECARSPVYLVIINNDISEYKKRLGDRKDVIFVNNNKSLNYQKQSDYNYSCDLSNQEQGRKLAEDVVKSEFKIQYFVDLSDILKNKGNELELGKFVFLQLILRSQSSQGFHLLHVTQGLIPMGQETLSLSGAPMAGFIKMLGAEYKKVVAKHIDIDNSSDLEQVVLTEINAKDNVSEICVRNGKRYVPYYSEVQNISDQSPLLCDEHGKTVIITGGTSGVGLQMAGYLCSKGVRKFVLMGIHNIPPREEWDRILNSSKQQADTRKIRNILELEKAGAKVELYIGELNDQAKLESYFNKIRQNWGEIGCVLHCAGVTRGTEPAFINKSIEDMQDVFRPKSDALHVLHEIFKNDKLDYFILFSSVSGAVPVLAPGISDYAAANAYMDYYAAIRYAEGYTYYKSVNWPSFKETGMGEIKNSIYLELGFTSITNKDAFVLFDSILKCQKSACVMPCMVQKNSFKTTRLIEVKQDSETISKSILAQPFKRVEKETGASINWLSTIFSKELMIPLEKLDVDTQFGDFGVDSIILAGLVKKIENKTEKDIEPSVLIEYPTLRMLSNYLDDIQAPDEDIETAQIMENISELERENGCYEFLSGRTDVLPIRSKEHKDIHTGSEKIAVIGMACHFPEAADKEMFWQNLKGGKCSIREIPESRWDKEKFYSPKYENGKSISKWGGYIEGIELFDHEYFGFSREEAIYMDPLMRQMLEVSAETLRDAGYEDKELWGEDVSVYVGARAGAFGTKIDKINKNSIVGIGQNFIAAHIAHYFNFKGTNMVIDTACSSSLIALHLACQSLNLGEAKAALVGGVDLLFDEQPYLVLSEGRALSPDGRCHTFDQKANGFVPGEGSGAVLLKTLDAAIADKDHIYAVIESTATNNDGHTMGITTPNPEAQSDVIREALNKYNINPQSISYVEAHGTGTMIGDPIELKALTKVFREYTSENQFCGVGSIKTNIGHLMSAAGISSLIKVILSLYHKQIPPTLHCDQPNRRFAFEKSPFYIAGSLSRWEPREGIRRAGISSFGFGGTNAHAIVSEYLPDPNINTEETRKPLPSICFNRQWCYPAEDVKAKSRAVLEGTAQMAEILLINDECEADCDSVTEDAATHGFFQLMDES